MSGGPFVYLAEVSVKLADGTEQRRFVKADETVGQFPECAEVLIWQGIIKSTYAGATGGLMTCAKLPHMLYYMWEI